MNHTFILSLFSQSVVIQSEEKLGKVKEQKILPAYVTVRVLFFFHFYFYTHMKKSVKIQPFKRPYSNRKKNNKNVNMISDFSTM